MSEAREPETEAGRQMVFATRHPLAAIRAEKLILAIEREAAEKALHSALPELDETRRLLGYLWTATGKNYLRPVSSLFAEDDPIVADIERLAILEGASE